MYINIRACLKFIYIFAQIYYQLLDEVIDNKILR